MKRVEFEHRRQGVSLHVHVDSREAARVFNFSEKVVRYAFLVVGLVAIAFVTQRAGLELPSALALFVCSAVPLGMMGFVAAVLLHARRMGGALTKETVQQGPAQVERVVIELDEELAVERTLNGQAKRNSWALRDVTMNRFGTDMLMLTLKTGVRLEHVQVPASAFTTPEAFDEFCLELQKRIWAAQR